MQARTLLTESISHLGLTERGEVAEGSNAEPAQEGHDRRIVEHSDRQGSEEARGFPRRDDAQAPRLSSPGRLLRGKHAVGNADAGVVHSQLIELIEKPQRGFLLAAVVGGWATRAHRADTRLQHVHSRHEPVDNGQHGLEGPRILCGSPRGDGELGAAGLSLAKLEPPGDTLGTSGG